MDKRNDEIVLAIPHFGYNRKIGDIAILRRVNGEWNIYDCNLFNKDSALFSNGGSISLEIEDIKIVNDGILILYRFLPVYGGYGTIFELRAIYIKNDNSFYSFGHLASPQIYYGPDGHSNLLIKDNGEIYTIYCNAHTQGGGSSYDNWVDLVLRYLGNINKFQ